MTDRSKPPARYAVREPNESCHNWRPYVPEFESSFGVHHSEESATGACWTHHDAIRAQERAAVVEMVDKLYPPHAVDDIREGDGRHAIARLVESGEHDREHRNALTKMLAEAEQRGRQELADRVRKWACRHRGRPAEQMIYDLPMLEDGTLDDLLNDENLISADALFKMANDLERILKPQEGLNEIERGHFYAARHRCVELIRMRVAALMPQVKP